MDRIWEEQVQMDISTWAQIERQILWSSFRFSSLYFYEVFTALKSTSIQDTEVLVDASSAVETGLDNII